VFEIAQHDFPFLSERNKDKYSQHVRPYSQAQYTVDPRYTCGMNMSSKIDIFILIKNGNEVILRHSRYKHGLL